jgi:hypothetical protein
MSEIYFNMLAARLCDTLKLYRANLTYRLTNRNHSQEWIAKLYCNC